MVFCEAARDAFYASENVLAAGTHYPLNVRPKSDSTK